MRLDNKLYKNQGIHVISAIFTIENKVPKVLLVRRKNNPFKDNWALPGGALYNNESLNEGIKREIYEKTGIKDVELYQFGVFDEMNYIKEINMRMIAITYLGLIDGSKVNIVKESRNTKNVEWFDINSIPILAFNHKEILNGAIEKLRELIVQSNILRVLLPKEFTMPQLQNIYEQIFEKQFDRRNFRKKVLNLNIIKDTKKEVNENGRRPAKLYKFIEKNKNKKVF